MQEKIIPSDAQEGLLKELGQLISVYEDRRHIKSAASRLFSREKLAALAPPPGWFMTHAITLGSSDMYGANRNADDFPHEQLLQHHDTFEKHAYNYREHRNKDPRLKVGDIKAAAYDPELQRGEIVFWTEIEKAAKEFERARAGEEQHGSMACNIDHDVCECCGFKSKYAYQRCSHIRDTPGMYVSSFGKYAHMINIKPTFKDYSWVERPADRIAHTLSYMMPENLKAASAGSGIIRGDELAEFYSGEPAFLGALRAIHSMWATPDLLTPAMKAASSHVLPRAFNGQFDEKLLAKMASHPSPARVLRSLAAKDMILPLPSFHSFLTGLPLSTSLSTPEVKEASSAMPHIRGILIRRVSTMPEAANVFGEMVRQFTPSECCCGDAIDDLFSRAQDQFSTRYEALVKRAAHNPIKIEEPAPASISNEAFSLGAAYQAYLCHSVSEDWLVNGLLGNAA